MTSQVGGKLVGKPGKQTTNEYPGPWYCITDRGWSGTGLHHPTYIIICLLHLAS